MTDLQLKYLAHQENVRHNLAAEGLSQASLDETVRSNQAKESETARSNLANEQIKIDTLVETTRMNEHKRGMDQFNAVLDSFDLGRKFLDTNLDNAADLIDAFMPF